MRPSDIMQGVASMGHVGESGHWHPGSQGTCDKCEPEQAQRVNKRCYRCRQRGLLYNAFCDDCIRSNN